MPSSPSAPARSVRPTLATWLFVSVLGATMAAVLTCTLVIERFVRDEARLEATRFLQTHADALRDALDRGMGQNYEEVHVIAQLDQVSAGDDPVAVRRALEQMHASFPQFAWLGLATPDGQVVASIDGLLQGVSVSARPWFSGAQHGMYVGDVHSALLLERVLPVQDEPWRFVDVATPVYAPDGRLRGILGAHLSWTWAAQIKRELIDAALQQHQAEALIVGTDGTVLLGSSASQGKKLAATDVSGELLVESHTHGAGRYPGLGWNVVLRQPEQVAMAAYRALQLRTRIAAALLCVLLAPLLWLLARRLATPMRELGLQLDAGDDAPRPARRHPLYREADLLGQALDRHAQRQREDAAYLRDLNAGLEARVAERTMALERINGELSQAMRDRWQSEERMRAVLTHAPHAYIAIDESGRISEWNRQAEQTFGWTRDEAAGRMLCDLLTPPEQRGTHRLGIAAFTRGGAAGHRIELAALHKTGVQIPVELSAASLRTDGGGEVAYAFLHDISQRRLAERQLAHSERRLRTVTDNMPALVSHIDTDMRYTFANATYARWFGFDPSKMIGEKVLDVVGREAFESVRDGLRRTLAGEPCSFENEIVVEGVRMHCLVHYVPDVDEHGVVQGSYGMVLDLSDRRAAELARALSEQRLRDITNAVPAVIACFDAQERCTFVNAKAARMFGIPADGVEGATLRSALLEYYDEQKPYIDRALAGERTSFDSRMVEAGLLLEYQTHFVPDLAPDGRVVGLYILAHDQTALMKAERRSAAGEQRLRTITDNLPVLISTIDRHERYEFCNGTYRAWFGRDLEQIVGHTMHETLGDAEYALREGYLRRVLAGERVDFDICSVIAGLARHLHTTYIPEAVSGGAYVMVTDVTAMKEAEAQLARQARTDSLTGLPNRHSFDERLEGALARSRRSEQPIALFFLDVDKFKAINDSLGHGAGDAVLKIFGQRLRAGVRETDSVARLAGDEFVVVLEGLRTPAEPQFIARKILAAMNRPFEVDGLSLDITTSIGIAFQADGRITAAELLAQADKALYEAKENGRNTFRMAAA